MNKLSLTIECAFLAQLDPSLNFKLVDKNGVVSDVKKQIYSTIDCSIDPIKIENIQAINEICIDRVK